LTEIVIILVIISILGYVFSTALPSAKYKKAKKLLDEGNIIGAQEVFEAILNKHPDAPAGLAECLLNKGFQYLEVNEANAYRQFYKIFDLKNRLPSKSNVSLFELTEAKAYREVCKINYNQILHENNAENKVKRLKENIILIDNSVKAGIDKDFSDLRLKHLSHLAEVYYELGKENEKSQNITNAIRDYSLATDYADQSRNSVLKSTSLARIGICKLKNWEHVDKILFEEVNNAPVDLKKDFYFRYVKKLVKEKDFSEADLLISRYLDSQSLEVNRIKEFIKSERIKIAVNRVNEINNTLDTLNNSSFSNEAVRHLYEDIDNYVEEIKPVLPTIVEKLNQLKPSLFNRLLIRNISENQYIHAIEMIETIPYFWGNFDLLKNLGICCINVVNQRELTENNYRMIVSSWITAVHSDHVILKSLESTSWDDAYTFTLVEAIGSNYSQHNNLPENVNYEEVSDTNISIGKTQKELVIQFESLIQQKITESSFATNVQDFYKEEKDSVEKIISVLPKDILFPSPYFAKRFELNEDIIKELDEDYLEYSNEQSLEAGIPYLKNYTDTYVREYASAKEVVATIVSAIEEEDLDKLESINTDRKIELIEKFETISSTIEDLLYNAFSLKIQEDSENEELISLFEECIDIVNENEKLKYQYSNYVANYCVAKVNEDEITNFDALSLMKNAFLFSSNNPRICKNIVTLIHYNLIDILNERTSYSYQIYQLLDEIYRERSIVLKQSSGELSKARSEMLNQLRQAGVDISLLIDNDPFQLAHFGSQGRSLTLHGEKLKKILNYMKMFCEN
jgi:hypothetical protein